MVILSEFEELERYLREPEVHISYPILIDAYVPGVEVEVDAVTDGEEVFIPAILEHVEKAGIHSGDSTAVTPPHSLSQDVKDTVVGYTEKIAGAMDFQGIFNIQFVVFGKHVYVLEINPRASRTVPVLSKITGVDLCDLTVKVLLGQSLQELHFTGVLPELPYYTVKMPVFSTAKLPGVDPLIGPEMQSTGEIIAIDRTMEAAVQKGLDRRESSAFDWDGGGEVYCDIDTEDAAFFDKIVSCLRNRNMTFVAASPDIGKKLGIPYMSYESWLKTDSKAMLISIRKSIQAGKAKRLLAQKHRLSVITDWAQFHLLLIGERAEEEQLKPVNEWIRQREGSPVNQ